ncbi:MAG: hypothetical protein U1D30_13570 [Planctomycetota bacterium]
MPAEIKKGGEKKAQEKEPVIAPGESLSDDWDEIDARFLFLVTRLMTVETLLKAIGDKQTLTLSNRLQQKGKSDLANRRITQNLKNGGAPIGWKKFYGKTADSFYLRSGNRAVTVLNQWSGNSTVVVAEGAPTMKQRPAAFDLVLKGEEKAKADADAELAKIGDKEELLHRRRAELELEQIRLWSQIAFRGVRRHDLIEQPAYRFAPMAKGEGVEARVEAMRETLMLMNVVLRIIEESERERMTSIGHSETLIKQARLRMTDTWLKGNLVQVAALSGKPDVSTASGRMFGLTRALENRAANLDQCYPAAIQDSVVADPTKIGNKEERWEQLRDNLVDFASVVLAMDETVKLLMSEWQVEPNVQERLQPPSLGSEETLAEEKPVMPVVPGAGSATMESVLPGLTAIRIKHPGKTITHAVSHAGVNVYIARPDGEKVPLTQEGNSLTWKMVRNGIARVDLESRTNQEGHPAELIYGTEPTASPARTAPRPPQKTARKRKNR